jgi:hypothetical protein
LPWAEGFPQIKGIHALKRVWRHWPLAARCKAEGSRQNAFQQLHLWFFFLAVFCLYRRLPARKQNWLRC